MGTLNDTHIFDFERFMEAYSRTIWPLFVWHLLFYIRHRKMSMHFDMAEFDKVIGLHRLKAVHVNDSLNPCGARKDRHARIGEGFLGTETFRRVVNHPALQGLPMVLETPNELEGYAREIALLRELHG